MYICQWKGKKISFSYMNSGLYKFSKCWEFFSVRDQYNILETYSNFMGGGGWSERGLLFIDQVQVNGGSKYE